MSLAKDQQYSSYQGLYWTARLLSLVCYISLLLPDFVQAEPSKRLANRLGKPLTGDDGFIYSCSGKFLYAFKNNGSMAWNARLNYTCNGEIAPVYGGSGKVFILAENKVLRVNFMSHENSDRRVKLLFGNESTEEISDEVLGLTASMLTSSVYVNIKNKGLFTYSMRGRLRWSVLPDVNKFGFFQGCEKNDTNCYFTSSPVIDKCESSVYISNNEGELYAISARGPHYKWIQDLSSFDKVYTITPGNNGFLYVTFPAKAIILALNAFTGEILWEKSIGPLSSPELSLVVDSNGWVSIGSLDGFLYSFSPTGTLKKFTKASPSDSVIQVSPVLDCSGYAIYISQTIMEGKTSRVIGDYTYVSAMKPKSVVFSLLVPATETFYWCETYPGEFSSNLSQSDLMKFTLDEEIVLAFIAAAKIGNPLSCRNSYLKLGSDCSKLQPKSISVYTGNERTILLLLLFQTIMLVVFAIIIRFCCIFWNKQKLQDQNLGKFLEKRKSLRLKKKEYDKMISELEQKAANEATTSNVVENLSSLVQERDSIKKKLSTTYSLGRDRDNSKLKPVLPIYDDKTKKYTFRGTKSETVTVFDTYSSTSSFDDESSLETNSEQEFDGDEEYDATEKGKGKAKELVERSTSSGDDDDDEGWEEFSVSSSRTSSGSRGFSDSVQNVTTAQSGRGKSWLFRRKRSLSFTN